MQLYSSLTILTVNSWKVLMSALLAIPLSFFIIYVMYIWLNAVFQEDLIHYFLRHSSENLHSSVFFLFTLEINPHTESFVLHLWNKMFMLCSFWRSSCFHSSMKLYECLSDSSIGSHWLPLHKNSFLNLLLVLFIFEFSQTNVED